MKNFHKIVTPPPSCICEILVQMFNRKFRDKIKMPQNNVNNHQSHIRNSDFQQDWCNEPHICLFWHQHLFHSKNLCCRFWTLNRAFSAWKWYKRVFLGYVFNQFNGNTMLNCCTTCISWEIGSYNTQQSRHTEHTHFCRNFVAKSATWFSKKEGGVKGRLELFRKYINFGDAILP